MKAIPRTVILSLIVFSTTWVSMATGAEPGITTLSGPFAESAPVAGSTRLQDTVGYAVSDPFGPIFHVEGNFGDGLGYDTGYWGVGGLLPYFTIPGKGMLFTAFELSGADDSGFVANLGGGYRQYAPNWDRIFGISGWYDFDSGHSDSYNRMGVSLESLGKYIDFRSNFYFLLDTDSKEISNGFTGDPFFRGNNIVSLRQIITEIPYQGAEFQVGGPVPFLGQYGVYAHVGSYYLDAKDFDSSIGFSSRIDVAATEDISVNVNFTNDDIFGFNTNVSVAWQFPDGRAERWFKPRPVRERLSSQVVRRERIPVRVERDVEPELLINPDDGEPFFIVHTDPNETAGTGNGTFENPFGSLEQARVINNPGIDIFRVIPREDGSGTNLAVNAPFVLFGTAGTGFVQQRVLGTSVEHTILAEQGLFDFPGFTGAGALPLVSNANNTAGSMVFQLANNNEISGIHIDGANSSSTDNGNGVGNIAPIQDWNLNRNQFTNHVIAVAITDSTGDGQFEDNEITGTAGISDDGLLLTNNAGTLDLVMTGNSSEQNERGYHLVTGGGTINAEIDDNTGNDNNGTNVFDPLAGVPGPIDDGGFVANAVDGNINITSFSGNEFTGNDGNGAVFAATLDGAGTTTVRNMGGNTFSENGANGVLVRAHGAGSIADVEVGNSFQDANTISGNGIGTDGGHGVRVEAHNGATARGAIVNNVISNNLFGQGISILASNAGGEPGGAVDFGTLPNRLIQGNVITGNSDAGISALLQEEATGRLIITANLIGSTTDGSDPLLDGEGIHIRTEDDSEMALLTIESNLIGVGLDGSNIGNVGDGVEIEMYQNSQMPDLNIVDNIVRFNQQSGVRINRNADAFLDNVVIDENVISDNDGIGLDIDLAGGDININGGGPLEINVTITENEMQRNGEAGLRLRTTADADLVATVDTNLITDNRGDGIDMGTDFFSQVEGTISNNQILRNGDAIGDHGIQMLDSNTGDPSFTDLFFNNNIIANNFEDGVNFLSVGGGFATVGWDSNTIRNNGGDGIEMHSTIQAVSTFNLTANNIIRANAEIGIEALADDISILSLNSTLTTIEQNGDDGVSLTTGTLSNALLGATLEDNTIRFNAGRGVDILNQWDSDMHIEILGSADPRPAAGLDPSLIDSNGLQGILVVNEADASRSLDAGLLTDNDIHFRLYQTEVRGNGTNAIADDDGNGLYFRVGTSQFGQVNADVSNNHFSGNANIDVVTESFVATMDPPELAPFNDDGSVNGAYRSDPVARLNFRLQNNVGQQIDVVRIGAFYDNEDEFKSIFGGNALFGSDSAHTRRRNAQRESQNVDMVDGIPITGATPADTVNVLGAPAPTEGTFATGLLVGTDSYVNAMAEFVNGVNNGLRRRITGSDPADQTITVTDDFPVPPVAGDDLTVIAYDQAGTGQSTFVTESATIAAGGNVFDTIISDFTTTLNYVDATVDEINYPFGWTTGAVFPAYPAFP